MDQELQWPERLRAHLSGLRSEDGPAQNLRALCWAGMDRLPMPGAGQTLNRWRALACVAEQDLSLAKLYESHTDALAILAELKQPRATPGSIWAVWAAEWPRCGLQIAARDGDRVQLSGEKHWCSGALDISHALVTVWDGERGPWLAAVPMNQPEIQIDTAHWQAVGMRDTASARVRFDGARARLVGDGGDYLNRPGFWHGGAGIAACWYGGAAALARALDERARQRADAHKLAHLGAVDVALRSTRALLIETARQIDAHPQQSGEALALRARAAAEQTVETVMRHVSRALGAGPYCMDERFARLAADLPVFVRQSHAERDLESLATRITQQVEGVQWQL